MMALRVYDEDGQHRGSFEHGEDAASFVSFLGDGATIRFGTIVLWTEGAESQPAGESYDYVTETIADRLQAHPDFKREARRIYEAGR